MSSIVENLPTFVVDEHFVEGSVCSLGEDAARHLKVLRLAVGAIVGLRDGAGLVGSAKVVKLAKGQSLVEVLSAGVQPPLPEVHLLVPVADRERLLWLAEKAGELGLTSWRPVLWRRSRSVAPRGEGPAFQAKVRARMMSALSQSQGAWLPQIFPEANLERALLAAPPGDRIVLDPDGEAFVGHNAALLVAPIVIALGPEGGFEQDELDALKAVGFRSASMGSTILRFETAGIAALAMARTALGVHAPQTT
ncbi:MAG: RsmE family RNA methyltransferase [Gemmatimonadaceae bacterium]